MNERMKLMIAYDGTVYADAAIDDLRRAGLARDAEALIVTVVEPSAVNPPVSEFDLHSLATRRAEAALSRAKAHSKRIFEEAEALTAKAAHRLRSQFPEWKIAHEVLHGKPAGELLEKAAAWKPDLIVAGSQGRSAIGRFFLGSVSKKIAEEAKCPVRIARRIFEKASGEPVKILAGARGLPDAEPVIKTICGRNWPVGTDVLFIAAEDGRGPGQISAVRSYAAETFERNGGGFNVSIDIKNGDLKDALLAEAENVRADSIFIAAAVAGGENGLDETAAGLITGARCTVEIVRANLSPPQH
jgi:nucleotide-binding universal stress UspA family protein